MRKTPAEKNAPPIYFQTCLEAYVLPRTPLGLTVAIFPFVHHTHAPAADFPEDAVVGNRLTPGLRGRGHWLDMLGVGEAEVNHKAGRHRPRTKSYTPLVFWFPNLVASGISSDQFRRLQTGSMDVSGNRQHGDIRLRGLVDETLSSGLALYGRGTGTYE